MDVNLISQNAGLNNLNKDNKKLEKQEAKDNKQEKLNGKNNGNTAHVEDHGKAVSEWAHAKKNAKDKQDNPEATYESGKKKEPAENLNSPLTYAKPKGAHPASGHIHHVPGRPVPGPEAPKAEPAPAPGKPVAEKPAPAAEKPVVEHPAPVADKPAAEVAAPVNNEVATVNTGSALDKLPQGTYISYSESFTYTESKSLTVTFNIGGNGENADAVTDKTAREDKTGNKDNGKMTIGRMADHNMTIEKLRADAEARLERLRELVEKILTRQYRKLHGISDDANNDFFRRLTSDQELVDAIKGIRDGKYEVTEEESAEAAEQISENGYWGVEQTSNRLVEFAIALSGNDTQFADRLIDAVKEGYKQVSDMFGGDDSMPDVCKNTLSRTLEKLDAWKNGKDYTTLPAPSYRGNSGNAGAGTQVTITYSESTTYQSSSTTTIIT